MLTNADDLDLDQQRQRLELVVEGTRLGMWDWNPQTNDVIFNDLWAEMLGYDISEISQSLEEWQSRVHPDDLESCYADITAHMEGKTSFYENVHRMRHRDGSWVYILDRGKVVERDAEGNPIRFTGTHTDITREKEAELKALEAMNAKSMFLANMSHEIRTPLNGVLGLLQLLERSTLDEKQQEWVSVIMNCSEGLLTIINDILDLSKIETGKITISPVESDIKRAFHLVYNLFQEKAQAKNLDYTLQLADNLPEHLLLDEQRVKQIVLNLVSNAIKFTKAGSVTISVGGTALSDDEWELCVDVQDTGKGIANPAAIWDRFAQEDNTISREFGGTGLGLAISKNFAELMGGSLEVSSELGAGSTFQLRIPARRVEAKPLEAGHNSPIEMLTPIRILVAEDNAINQMVIKQVLANLGMTPEIVTDGEAVVQACQDKEYDLVFMDLHMPKLNGLEATLLIKNNPATAGHPSIVGLSADALTTSREACMEAGMDGFIMKPFKIEDITAVIARISSQRTAREMLV